MALFIHPHTESLLTATSRSLPHGLLLSGPRGLGLSTLVSYLLGQSGIALKAQVIEPDDKGTISIDAIRVLYQQTRTKHAARVIVIKDSDRMTIAAQNAFLKLLEEPNPGLHFILTSHVPHRMLATILSRVQHVTARRLTSQQTQQFLQEQGIVDAARIAQLQFIAEGLPAALTELLQDEATFRAKAQIVRDAREFLQGEGYDRLLLLHKYSTDRTKAVLLLQSAMHILSITLEKNPQPAMIDQLHRLLEAEDRIHENGHVRTQLLRTL